MRNWFRELRAGSTLRDEIIGGSTTFLTMSYIIFVQPAVLARAGMDSGAVMVATCLGSAFATLLMALLANYPIALAPAMGHNFYLALTVCLAQGVPWQTALGANFLAGAAFLLLSVVGLRERLIDAVPPSLRQAIAAGIGFLIAFVGLQWGGLVRARPGILVGLGDLASAPARIALAGLAVGAVLLARGAKVALAGSIAVAAAVAWWLGLVRFSGIVAPPPSLAPTFMKIDIGGVLRPDMLGVVFVLFFLALFDTIGTLVGVATQAGLMRDGRLPRARRALIADSSGIVAGTLLGTSTITCYVESAAGVAAGARAGLSSVVTAVLLLASVFFWPVVEVVGGGVGMDGERLYPVVAPPLVLVGSLMARALKEIPWDDPTDAVPAFLTLLIMPLSLSISEGISVGVIAYVLLKTLAGRGREVPALLFACAVLFVVRYAAGWY